MSEAHGAPSPSGSRRPGGTDVARLAGVSQKTVSRVFNNEPYVGDQVRRRVLEAARQLGYRPNLAARALQSGRTHRIGVASLGSALFGPATLLVALERAARQTGYALSIVNTFEDEQGSLADALLNLLAQDVDAIVLLEPIDEGETSLTVDVPVLMLGRAPLVSAPKVLTVDAGEAGDPAEDVVRHMLALGHATVHHVAGPLRWWAARERLDGWQRVLKEEGRTVPSYVEGNWTAASGYRAGQELARDPEVTAVFVANDDMAIGVLRALQESGLHVPRDVSLVGFDDIPPAAYLSPALTTVRPDNTMLATVGLQRLVGFLQNPEASPVLLPAPMHQLMLRESTGRRRGARQRGAAMT
jgi:DNA-binding LacI/PurR family transcriptional regulator